MTFVKDPLNATEPREIIEYSQDLENRVEEGFDNVDEQLNEIPADGGITSGSNDYGYWTKFPDGTLINRGSVTMAHADSDHRTYTITFPLAFVDTNYNPSVVPNAGGIANFGAVLTDSYTTTTMGVSVTRRSTANLEMTWLVIGRWK